jgi:hypothetical protein
MREIAPRLSFDTEVEGAAIFNGGPDGTFSEATLAPVADGRRAGRSLRLGGRRR